MPVRHIGGVEVYCHSFINPTVDNGGEFLRSGRIILWEKSFRYPPNINLHCTFPHILQKTVLCFPSSNVLDKYKVVQIWPGQTVTCLHTISPGHIWTTLYIGSAFTVRNPCRRQSFFLLCDTQKSVSVPSMLIRTESVGPERTQYNFFH
jgi:hypothetical protein